MHKNLNNFRHTIKLTIKNTIKPLNAHPFFYATLLLIGGIACAALNKSSYAFWGTAGLLMVVIAYSYYQKPRISLLFFLSCFMLGYGRYMQQTHRYKNIHALLTNTQLATNPQHTANTHSFQGIITDCALVEHPRMKQCITIKIYKFKTADTWQDIDFCLQLYTPFVNPHSVGDALQIDDIQIKKTASESFERYLIKENIGATLFCYKLRYHLIARPHYSLVRYLFTTRERIFDAIRKKMPTESFTLFSSLFLGNRAFNKRSIHQIADQFQLWGISHYLARSGLHLTIFTIIWYSIFRLLPFSFFFKQVLLMLLSIIYLMLSWTSVSFLRALYSFIIYGFCTLSVVRTDFLSIITAVTFFVLLINPMQLFFLDFQLSFVLTFALAWINHTYHSPHLS